MKTYSYSVNLNKFSLDTIWENFTLSDSIILVEHLIRWKRDLEIILIDHYAGDNGNKNIAGMY